jgi:hypothetical protein
VTKETRSESVEFVGVRVRVDEEEEKERNGKQERAGDDDERKQTSGADDGTRVAIALLEPTKEQRRKRRSEKTAYCFTVRSSERDTTLTAYGGYGLTACSIKDQRETERDGRKGEKEKV